MTSIIKKDNYLSLPISTCIHDAWVTLKLKKFGTYVITYGQLSEENITNNYIGIITAPKNSNQSAVVTDITPNRSTVGLEYNLNNGFSLGIHAKSTSWGILRVIEIWKE